MAQQYEVVTGAVKEPGEGWHFVNSLGAWIKPVEKKQSAPTEPAKKAAGKKK